jgi:hypothetical protein
LDGVNDRLTTCITTVRTYHLPVMNQVVSIISKTVDLFAVRTGLEPVMVLYIPISPMIGSANGL